MAFLNCKNIPQSKYTQYAEGIINSNDGTEGMYTVVQYVNLGFRPKYIAIIPRVKEYTDEQLIKWSGYIYEICTYIYDSSINENKSYVIRSDGSASSESNASEMDIPIADSVSNSETRSCISYVDDNGFKFRINPLHCQTGVYTHKSVHEFYFIAIG